MGTASLDWQLTHWCRKRYRPQADNHPRFRFLLQLLLLLLLLFLVLLLLLLLVQQPGLQVGVQKAVDVGHALRSGDPLVVVLCLHLLALPQAHVGVRSSPFLELGFG